MLSTPCLNPSTRSMQALFTEWWRMTAFAFGLTLPRASAASRPAFSSVLSVSSVVSFFLQFRVNSPMTSSAVASAASTSRTIRPSR